MSTRMYKLKKRASGVGEGAERDRHITIMAYEWNAVVDNFELLEKRNEALQKQVDELQKQIKRLGK